MTTAREIMTADPVCVRSSDSVREAASQMAQLHIGSVPICGEDNRLKGMLTDRDIVVKVLAEGKDPQAVHAGELAQGEAITIGADPAQRAAPGPAAPRPEGRSAGPRRHPARGAPPRAIVGAGAVTAVAGRSVDAMP